MMNGAGFNPYYAQQQSAYVPQFCQANTQYPGTQFQGPSPPPPFMFGRMPGVQQGGFNGPQGFGPPPGTGFGGPNGGNPAQMREQIDSVFSQFNLNAKEVFAEVRDVLGGKRPESPEEMQTALTQVLQDEGLSSEDIQTLESQLPPPPPSRMDRHRPLNSQADVNGNSSANCSDATDSTGDFSITTDTSTSSADLSTVATQLSSLLSLLSGGATTSGTNDASAFLTQLCTLLSSYTATTAA